MKKVFATVGTTSFDEMIDAILKPNFLQVLEEKGFTHLTLQIGQGSEPRLPLTCNLILDWFSLKDGIKDDIQSASLVISHAGAGSCLEVLGEKKPLIVVVNQSLMGNHQLEIASKLHQDGYAFMCYPETMLNTLNELDTTPLKLFPSNSSHKFSDFLLETMGVS